MEAFKAIFKKTTERLGGIKLTLSETNMLYYIYKDLDMSEDLIMYLLDYCVARGKGNIRYIKKVAEAWHEEGITTVEQAKMSNNGLFSLCYNVLKEMCISGRYPAPAEMKYCEKWTGEYGFTEDMILVAAQRTINSLHKPSFSYCDGILKRWLKEEIKTVEQIKVSDELHEARKKKIEQTKVPSKSSFIPNNRFDNFEGRQYDINALEKALLRADNRKYDIKDT